MWPGGSVELVAFAFESVLGVGKLAYLLAHAWMRFKHGASDCLRYFKSGVVVAVGLRELSICKCDFERRACSG